MALTSVGLMAQSGTYTGPVSVMVGGIYGPYTNEQTQYELTFHDDATLDVTLCEYSLAGTVMGDLTLGQYTVSGLTYDATQDCYYRNYQNDGLSMHFKAVSGGVATMDADYTFEKNACTLQVTATETGYTIVNSFQPGAMPFPIVATATVTRQAPANVYGFPGSGTDSDPYQITSKQDFYTLAEKITADNTGLGEVFEVMNDIDFAGDTLPSIAKAGIETITKVHWGFAGTLRGKAPVDGNYDGVVDYNDVNTILSGIKPGNTGKFNSLVSSLAPEGTVQYLYVDGNCDIQTVGYAAPLVCISQGLIETCVNMAPISTTAAFAGGICAYMVLGKGTIRDCANFGRVSASTYAAGIVAGTQSGSSITDYQYLVEKCNNVGGISTLNGTGSAGIAGSYSGKVKDCNNWVAVDDSKGTGSTIQYTAGIVSCASYAVSIENCRNAGIVSGGKCVAGILGNVMKGDQKDVSVSGCTNEGTVTGTTTNIAGIVANTARTEGIVTLTSCVNTGNVYAPEGCETCGHLRGNDLIVIGEGCENTVTPLLPLDPGYQSIRSIFGAQEVQPGTQYDLQGRPSTTETGLLIREGRISFVR